MHRDVRNVLSRACVGAGLFLAASCGPTTHRASPALAGSAEPVSAEVVAPAVFTVGVADWTYEGTPGRMLVTPNYRIHTTVTRDALLERLPRLMEAAIPHYRTAITALPAPDDALESFIFANRPQWERMTQRLMGSEAAVYLRIDRGGFTARGRSVLFDIGMRDTLSIAAHEGWHQYSQSVFRDQLPTPFEEGLATYMEGFRLKGEKRDEIVFLPWANPERFFMLRGAAQRERLMDLPTLIRSTPQSLMRGDENDALLYYAQVWALIHFLNDGEGGKHRPALQRMVRDAAAGSISSTVREAMGGRAGDAYRVGRRSVDLLKVYTGSSAEDLEPAYRAFIEHITRVGAGEKVMKGESPVE